MAGCENEICLIPVTTSSTSLNAEFMTFSSQSCPQVKFSIDSSSCSNKVVRTTEVEHLWDSSFSLKLFLSALCCHKINLLRQLRGFIPGIVLNWINPKSKLGKVGSTYKFWISCARLDHAFYLNKYSKSYFASEGRHYSVDWTTGLDYWTGLLDSQKLPLEEKGTAEIRHPATRLV